MSKESSRGYQAGEHQAEVQKTIKFHRYQESISDNKPLIVQLESS